MYMNLALCDFFQLSSSYWRGDGQTDSVPGVRIYGGDPLSLLENFVMRIGDFFYIRFFTGRYLRAAVVEW